MPETLRIMADWSDIADGDVVAACEGQLPQRTSVPEALYARVRTSVLLRLKPSPAQQDVADDIAQDVILALMEGLASLRNRTRRGLLAFASGIVSNKVADWIAKHGKQRPWQRGTTFWEVRSDDGTSPLSALARAQLLEAFMWALPQVANDLYRETLRITIVDGKLTRDAAEELSALFGRKIERSYVAVLLPRAGREVWRLMKCWNAFEPENGNAS